VLHFGAQVVWRQVRVVFRAAGRPGAGAARGRAHLPRPVLRVRLLRSAAAARRRVRPARPRAPGVSARL